MPASSLRGASPHPLEGPVLQRPQQLRLQRQRQLADLVEEHDAARRHLEQPALGLLGVGERPLLVAEQLALHQLLRKRRAVDLHEQRVLAGTAGVDGPRHHLLAGARLPQDEHRGRADALEPAQIGEQRA
jgi:hypothetical protein